MVRLVARVAAVRGFYQPIFAKPPDTTGDRVAQWASPARDLAALLAPTETCADQDRPAVLVGAFRAFRQRGHGLGSKEQT